MSTIKIMAVDDEPFNLEIITELLQDNYELLCVEEGEQALAELSDFNPDIILLDVSMPRMDGYEVCRKIKQSPITKTIPVMFISARGTLEERIEGYDCGAEDYIVKPFAREELEAKIQGLIRFIEQRKQLVAEVSQATDVAFNAMTASSEISHIIHYVENVQQLHSMEKLIELTFHTLEQFGLAAYIEYRGMKETEYYASQGSCSPIILELFELLRGKGRIYSFTPRILFNFNFFSILILNMPDDEEFMGRLRDHLCFIGSAGDHRIQNLHLGYQLEVRQNKLFTAIEHSKFQLASLVELIHEQHQKNQIIFKELQQEYDYKIPHLGLDEDQEKFIIQSLDKAVEKSIGRTDVPEKIEEKFHEIEASLGKLL